jgi:hypothetical protein
MKGVMRYIFAVCATLLLAFSGCDVHEFPVERNERVPFLLHLNFDTELSFYKEIPYTRSGDHATKAPVERHDVRYVIKAYRTDNIVGVNHVADTTFVFTKSDLADLNYTAPLELKEGTYRFAVWCDYVDAGSKADKYYDTSDFLEVILKNKENHVGSNNARDVFRGYATAEVINPKYYSGAMLNTIENEATAQMTRPVGKVQFISTDVVEFLTRAIEMLKQQGLLSTETNGTPKDFEQLAKDIDLSQFKVIVRYDFNMPCSYDMIYDKPADSWTNMSFESSMDRISTTEMILGFDYVFVGELGTTLNMSVEVYNNKGELMSRSKSVQVPFMPSKLTTVRGQFLTSIASGGVSINPGYDKDENGDDYNMDITDVMQ